MHASLKDITILLDYEGGTPVVVIEVDGEPALVMNLYTAGTVADDILSLIEGMES